jgi:hypothetical protein
VSTAAQAATGSSATVGPAGSVMPHLSKKNSGSHSTRWPTTSRATQPCGGAGFSHACAGTSTTRWVNCAAMLR